MSVKARRGWAVGLVAFFVVLCALIGISQWYAIHVNVPAYEARQHGGGKAP
jgi:hypothetical protein